MRAYDFSRPTRHCDVVMKGGVTSGVVYPPAICELAETYRFRSIGGTSAGAIAAALAAAAELGRATPDGGFARLAQLPDWLGARGNLFGLFQPQPGTTRLFAAVQTLANARRLRAPRALAAAVLAYPVWALLAALLPAAAAVAGLVAGGTAGTVAALTGGLVALAALPLGALLGLGLNLLGALPRNGYGLCRGLEARGSRRVALSTFLHREINRLAGRGPDQDPVTFGDLWGTRDSAADRRIDLVLMTSSLTHGRPFRVPFEQDVFYFDPAELRRYLPDRVVDWMVAHQGRSDDAARTDGRYLKLPPAADLPIAFAARLSCSFPILLSAVPLFAVDFTRRPPADGGPRPLVACWFSDGGIASNFPIHFFDSPLPSRPTFGINLRGFHPDHPRDDRDQRNNVWMPSTNGAGRLERFAEVPDRGLGRLPRIIGMMLDTMQNWRDNGLLHLPGYRDRVVTVNLADDEGGLNLGMPPERVRQLSRRGAFAGELLRRRYAGPPEPDVVVSWDNHRWVRFRTLVASLHELLGTLMRAYARDLTPDLGYPALLARGDADPPPSYRLRARERDAAVGLMKQLDDLLGEIRNREADFQLDSPRPMPALRITPRDQ